MPDGLSFVMEQLKLCSNFLIDIFERYLVRVWSGLLPKLTNDVTLDNLYRSKSGLQTNEETASSI